MYSFSYLEPVCCSMSSSNCCFLTCIQISQDAGQMAWYSHLFQNFPQFVVIHTVKVFGIVSKKTEVDASLKLSGFFNDPTDVGNLISVSKLISFSQGLSSSLPSATCHESLLFDSVWFRLVLACQVYFTTWIAGGRHRGSLFRIPA